VPWGLRPISSLRSRVRVSVCVCVCVRVCVCLYVVCLCVCVFLGSISSLWSREAVCVSASLFSCLFLSTYTLAAGAAGTQQCVSHTKYCGV